MAQSVTIGGDRLGSGNKEKVYLRNYERSTHDLTETFASTMGVGYLVPFLVKPAMRGDHFSIKTKAAARTIPTVAPLFGSFKLQTDYFLCPIRLYQAILHNNPLAIGLKMNQVLLPQLKFSNTYTPQTRIGLTKNALKFGNSSLMKYLGMSGLGRWSGYGSPSSTWEVQRFINAVPMLAYYDIFKTYYANKQEDKAYVLTTTREYTQKGWGISSCDFTRISATGQSMISSAYFKGLTIAAGYDAEEDSWQKIEFNIEGKNLDLMFNNRKLFMLEIELYDGQGWTPTQRVSIAQGIDYGYIQDYAINDSKTEVSFYATGENIVTANGYTPARISATWGDPIEEISEDKLIIKDFNLSNIDDMRMRILSSHTLGQPFIIQPNESAEPYKSVIGIDAGGNFKSCNNLNGLVLKTYQSDMFNSWVNTEWIDGENGIAAITAISTEGGSITIDSINLSEKLYNMLNRIAISGATYEDYLDSVYTESPRRHIESPVYCGGMSSEIVFEEIVQTTPTDGSPLGTLGGKGTLVHRKGGSCDIKVDEPSFIIGIVSITPRLFYTQGNEFYMTELKSVDDMHKPALDGIGFQDLLSERLAWFSCALYPVGSAWEWKNQKVGKLPAWIEYMTSVNKAYGEFADNNADGQGFMILSRNYEEYDHLIKDCTTYVDPSKYNYAFADARLDAQNFWVEIESTITARRLMSAKQIPNV